MVRDQLARQLDHDPNFRWRGEAVTRIENLSDIVFALALGMLVSASNPPETYQELFPHLMNIVPVAAGFTIMLVIWNAHFTFFRRYGVADGYTVFLNAVLLLFILFIAYPLRFAFDSLFAWLLGSFAGSWDRIELLGLRNYRDAGHIIAWFSLGLAMIYCLILLMYRHALAKADLLDLNNSERAMTRRSIWRYGSEMMIAILIVPLAAFTPLGPMAAILGVLNWPIAIAIRKRIRLEPGPSASKQA